MEDNRKGRASRIAAQTDADIKSMLERHPDRSAVVFTSGEPTLNPMLSQYTRWARDVGFKEIGLVSNGRRFSYVGYANEIIEAGMNCVAVSIHGNDSRIHDGLTRTVGSFEQTWRGLQNLLARRHQFPALRIHTSTVVTRRNVATLGALVKRLADAHVDTIVLNVMAPKGRGATHIERLMPRYESLVAEIASAILTLPGPDLHRVRVIDIPPCVSAPLPGFVVGKGEDFQHYERRPSWLGRVLRPSRVHLASSSRAEREMHLRSHGPPCEGCTKKCSCPGVWTSYAEAFGWAEFTAVRARAAK